MTNKPLLLFLLAACLFGFAGCKDAKDTAKVKDDNRLQSYKLESRTRVYGTKEAVDVVLRYDDQKRLLTYNNDSVDWKYVYRADGEVDVSGKFRRDGADYFSGTITLNSARLPEVENYLFFKDPDPEFPIPLPDALQYTYDEKGRLATVHEMMGADDYSYTIDIAFTYVNGSDDATGWDYHMQFAGQKQTRRYEFEYLDAENTLDFYPEVTAVMPMNAGFQITGRSGYRHGKLLKRIKSFDEAGVPLWVVGFIYQHDADGKMTELKLTMQRIDPDENPVGEEEFIRYYDMKY